MLNFPENETGIREAGCNEYCVVSSKEERTPLRSFDKIVIRVFITHPSIELVNPSRKNYILASKYKQVAWDRFINYH